MRHGGWSAPVRRPRRWLQALTLAGRDLVAANGTVLAGSLAFYTVLSLFPLVIGALIVASYLTDPAWVAERLVAAIEDFLPGEHLDPAALVQGAERERTRLGIVALVVVLFSGRRVLGTIVVALNRVSDVDSRQDAVQRRVGVEAGLIAGLAALAGVALLARPAIAAVERTLAGGADADGGVGRAVLAVVQGGLIFAALALAYAIVPMGRRDWRAVVIGAGVATALFLVVRATVNAVFGTWWQTVATLYGPFAAAAFLLAWVYWVALVVLFGAALASHVKVMLIEGAATPEVRRRHGQE